jgi:hydrogenase nickel incorporation protein HypA/HybF
MHELPVIQSILEIVLKHAETHRVKKVHAIGLMVGALSDLEDEWMQRYFDYNSKGTIAEGAKLKIERIPAVLLCSACGHRFEVDKTKMDGMACPTCRAQKFTLVSGREYHIKNMEAE